MIDINKISLHHNVSDTNRERIEKIIIPHVELMRHENKSYFVMKDEKLFWNLLKSYKSCFNISIHYDGESIEKIIPQSQWIKLTTEIPEEISELKGIYGLYVDDIELVYIGYTLKSFSTRFSQHIAELNNKSTTQKLYIYLAEKEITAERLSIKPLFTTNDEQGITQYGLECIEHAFINYFKPIGNISGNTSSFRHSSYFMNKDSEEQRNLIEYATSALSTSLKEYFENLKKD